MPEASEPPVFAAVDGTESAMTGTQTAQPLSEIAPIEYDAASGTYRTRVEPGEDYSVSLTIVAAIATIEALDPCDLSVRLHDCIDPDALEALFRRGPDGASNPDDWVEFTFDTYDVCVHADGRIVIRS